MKMKLPPSMGMGGGPRYPASANRLPNSSAKVRSYTKLKKQSGGSVEKSEGGQEGPDGLPRNKVSNNLLTAPGKGTPNLKYVRVNKDHPADQKDIPKDESLEIHVYCLQAFHVIKGNECVRAVQAVRSKASRILAASGNNPETVALRSASGGTLFKDLADGHLFLL